MRTSFVSDPGPVNNGAVWASGYPGTLHGFEILRVENLCVAQSGKITPEQVTKRQADYFHEHILPMCKDVNHVAIENQPKSKLAEPMSHGQLTIFHMEAKRREMDPTDAAVPLKTVRLVHAGLKLRLAYELIKQVELAAPEHTYPPRPHIEEFIDVENGQYKFNKAVSVWAVKVYAQDWPHIAAEIKAGKARRKEIKAAKAGKADDYSDCVLMFLALLVENWLKKRTPKGDVSYSTIMRLPKKATKPRAKATTKGTKRKAPGSSSLKAYYGKLKRRRVSS